MEVWDWPSMLAWTSACKWAGSSFPACTTGFLTDAYIELAKNRPTSCADDMRSKLIAGLP